MEEERWWSDGETMETVERSGEMNAQCEKPKFAFGRITKETRKTMERSRGSGANRGGGRSNLSRGSTREMDGGDQIAQSQSEVGAGSNRNAQQECIRLRLGRCCD